MSRPLRSLGTPLLALSALFLTTTVALAAPAEPAPPDGWWVINHAPAQLWSGPGADAENLGSVRQWGYFLVYAEQEGDRLPVWDPLTGRNVWIDALAVGPGEAPPPEYVAPPEFRLLETLDLPGRLIGNPDLWARPWRREWDHLGKAAHNQRVQVVAAFEGEDGSTWYRLAGLDEVAYAPAESVRLPRPVAGRSGRWIDADLREPVLVTAYEGARPVYSALAVKGIQAWETPVGEFRILRRVANETMDSATIGIPRNAPGGYYLRNVLFTQYFTWSGASLHYNYWRSAFGYAGSHGCLGLNYQDALWFWNWAEIGTPIVIHY